MKSKPVTHVSLVLIPEATASTLLSVYDIFNLFQKIVPGERSFTITIVSNTTAPLVTASALSLQAQFSFDDAPASDVVIVPSLLLPDQGWSTGRYPGMVSWLQREYDRGAILCSACSGIFPLLETGLFDDVPVTCHWFYEDRLRSCFPNANVQIEKTLIIGGDGNRLIMSGASASWHDLVLYLICRFSGPAAASSIARFFLLSWHPEGQTPYSRFNDSTSHSDATIIQAQAWIRQHWNQARPVDELVRCSGMAERSFKRRFKNATGLSPMDYVQHTRIEHARQLLENSNMPVDDIAFDIGYEDPAFFRKLFKRITTMTPSAYRMKFRTPYNVANM